VPAHAPALAVIALSLVLQATPPASPAPRATQTPAAARPGGLSLTVTSETGEFLIGATVSVHGPVDRGGTTVGGGTLLLQNMPAGTYRCRISHDGFVTLEKEVTIRAGVRLATEAVLSPAPPPPAPPPPPPAPAPTPTAPTLAPGSPRVESLPDIAEQLLRENKPLIEHEIGCSGATSSRLIVVRDAITPHDHADADETLYLLAGDATLKLGDRDQNVSAGWVGIVPRGMLHALTRRGRNPIVVLSVRSGPPCGPGLF
jgi:mannose-6-phosphate isomerase-like protein (cupin superfamily)